MEYLPTDTNLQPMQKARKEQKMRDFRTYLVEKEVTLALTKFLLALREMETRPENPMQYMQEFFGEYRDPLWDEVERLEAENSNLVENIPKLEEQVIQITKEIADQKIKNKVRATYAAIDKENTNQISTKLMVQKLGGFAKFDVDIKISGDQFEKFCLESLLSEEYIDIFNKAFTEEVPPFQGDLENESYTDILNRIRNHDFNPAEQCY